MRDGVVADFIAVFFMMLAAFAVCQWTGLSFWPMFLTAVFVYSVLS